MISFEIANIGRARVLRFLGRAFPNAVVQRHRADDFGELALGGRKFVVAEPWGDNSRYTIHEVPARPSPELDALRKAFEDYRPSRIFSWF